MPKKIKRLKPNANLPEHKMLKAFEKRTDENNPYNMLNQIVQWKHIKERHAGKSDIDLLNRNANGRYASSTFEDPTDARNNTYDALRMELNTILHWSSRAPIGETAQITVNIDESPLGKGFCVNKKTGVLEERQTDSVTLMLKKIDSIDTPFLVQTAFPEIEAQTATRTKRPLSEIHQLMTQTDAYKKAGSAQRTYIDYITTPAESGSKRYITYAGPHENEDMLMNPTIFVTTQTKDPNIIHTIKLRDHSYQICTQRQDTEQPVLSNYLRTQAVVKGRTPKTEEDLRTYAETTHYHANLKIKEVHEHFAQTMPKTSAFTDQLWEQIQKNNRSRSRSKTLQHPERIAQATEITKDFEAKAEQNKDDPNNRYS